MLEAIFDVLSRLTSEAAATLLNIGAGVGSIALGIWVGRKSRRQWLGWLVGAVAMVVLYTAVAPSVDALRRVACSGRSDYASCLEGGEGGGDWDG